MATRLLVHRNPWDQKVGFAIVEQNAAGEVLAYAQPVNLNRLIEDGSTVEPTFQMCEDEVQVLVNQLWHLGYRPKDADYNGEAFKAQGAHLADMRRLIFSGARSLIAKTSTEGEE